MRFKAILFVYVLGFTHFVYAVPPALPQDNSSPEAQAVVQQYMSGPSVFIENAGQWKDTSIRFALDGTGANVGLTDHGPRFQLFRKRGSGVLAADGSPISPQPQLVNQKHPSDPSDPSDPKRDGDVASTEMHEFEGEP